MCEGKREVKEVKERVTRERGQKRGMEENNRWERVMVEDNSDI